MRTLLLRVGAIGILTLLYFGGSWGQVASWVRTVVAAILNLFGYGADLITFGDILILNVENESFSFTDNCTYLSLFFIVAPFCWSLDKKFANNILILAFASVFIAMLNFIRIVAAIHFNLAGINWEYAHTIPNIIIHILVIFIFSLPVIRGDLEHDGDFVLLGPK